MSRNYITDIEAAWAILQEDTSAFRLQSYNSEQTNFKAYLNGLFKRYLDGDEEKYKDLLVESYGIVCEKRRQVITDIMKDKYGFEYMLDTISKGSKKGRSQYIMENLWRFGDKLKTIKDTKFIINNVTEKDRWKIYEFLRTETSLTYIQLTSIVKSYEGFPLFRVDNPYDRNQMSFLKNIFYHYVTDEEKFDSIVEEGADVQFTKQRQWNSPAHDQFKLRKKIKFKSIDDWAMMEKFIKHRVNFEAEFETNFDDTCQFILLMNQKDYPNSSGFGTHMRGVFEAVFQRLAVFLKETDAKTVHEQLLKEIVTVTYGNGFAKNAALKVARKYKDIGDIVLSFKKL